MLAFTSTENVSEFLSEAEAGKWNLHLAGDREGLILMIAIAHNHGRESIYFDPKPDGTGGREVTLNELLIFAESLR